MWRWTGSADATTGTRNEDAVRRCAGLRRRHGAQRRRRVAGAGGSLRVLAASKGEGAHGLPSLVLYETKRAGAGFRTPELLRAAEVGARRGRLAVLGVGRGPRLLRWRLGDGGRL